MRHHPLLVLPLSLLFAVLSPAGTARADGPSDATSKAPSGEDDNLGMARAYFKNGVELLSSTPPNYQDAYSQFQLALKTSGGNWKVLSNLGYCAMKLERDAEAIEHYERYIEAAGDEIDEAELADLKKELLLMRGNMGTLELSSDESDVRVLVKREGSPAPSQSYELTQGGGALGLRAGTHQIIATSGSKELRVNLVLEPGKVTTHRFDFSSLEKQSETRIVEVRTAEPTAKEKPRTLRTMGYIIAGTSLTVLGAGVASYAMARSEVGKSKDIFENECAVNSGEVFCTKDQIDAIETADKRSRNFETFSYVGYGVGGAMLATGLTFLFLDLKKQAREEAREQAHLRFSPELSLSSLGARAAISF